MTKIAIHYSTSVFTKNWIEYCKKTNLDFKIVNCYDNDIVEQLKDVEIVLWHHNHANPKDVLFAKQLLFSLESSGKKVFPDFNSGWHFDDKLGQKYLFESKDISHINTYAFYSKKEAVDWVEKSTFPKVFKLRRGAGAKNVKLIKNQNQAKSIINIAFGKGFRQYNAVGSIKEEIKKFSFNKTSLLNLLKAFVHFVYPIQLEKSQGRERGYVYFQDFIPNLSFDYRVKVIGDKLWAFKRMVRKGDFRASGSGNLVFDNSQISIDLIKFGFMVADKLGSSCIAMDIVADANNVYRLIEVSYGFGFDEMEKKNGFWTKDFNFHNQEFDPFQLIIDDLLLKNN